VGSVLFIGAIFCILSALTFYTGNTSTPTIRLSMLFLGITLLLSFILVEKRHPCPLLSLDIYKIHAFAFGNLIRLLASNSYYALLLIIPFYAQAGLNLSPSQSGMLLLPFTLSFLIIAPLGGHLADRLGTRPITSIGFAISAMTTAVFLLSNYLWHKTPSSLELSFVLLFYGIGLALINGPNNGAVLRAVSHRQKGVASGLLFTLGFLGGSCGIAITSGIIHREQMAKLSESLTILYAGTDVFYFLLFINCLGSILSLMRPNTNHHK
jgi:nitrate/nitrite transporter NarK